MVLDVEAPLIGVQKSSGEKGAWERPEEECSEQKVLHKGSEEPGYKPSSPPAWATVGFCRCSFSSQS